MGSDATMVNAPAPAISISKDVGKKKKNNTAARLKKCKLDARREQWLSHVKCMGCKIANDSNTSPSSPRPVLSRSGNKDSGWSDSIEVRPKIENDNKLEDGHRDSDMDSPFNSPTSSSSGLNFSMKNCPADSLRSHSSCSSDSYSRSVNRDKDGNDEDGESVGGEDEGFDDWEAVADALTISDNPQDNPKSETSMSPVTHNTHDQLPSNSCDRGILKKPEVSEPLLRAWRPDDAFRPQSLPSLSKHLSFSMSMDRSNGLESRNWTNECPVKQPQCPICYEDLDLTDSSFLPCSCGFHLCLFCHKRIMEDDGRCPGCRKQYSPMVEAETVVNAIGKPLSCRMSRSCSMNPRC